MLSIENIENQNNYDVNIQCVDFRYLCYNKVDRFR